MTLENMTVLKFYLFKKFFTLKMNFSENKKI